MEHELSLDLYTAELPKGVQELLGRFEMAWQDGAEPRLEDFLHADGGPAGTPARRVLEELVQLDLNYRWRRSARRAEPAVGSAPCLEDYLARFPELGPA